MEQAGTIVDLHDPVKASQWINVMPPSPPERDSARTAIEDKIRNHDSSAPSQPIVRSALAKSDWVRSLKQFESLHDALFRSA